jgi:alanine racemase
VTALHEPTVTEDELRPTHLEVDLAVLAENYAAIARRVAPARVMPILKANAYGHGLVAVAQKLESIGAPYVGVAYLEEGLRLRQAGVRMPVLVMGGIVGSQVPRFLQHDLTLTASSVDKLTAIDECAARMGQKARVHLKIDTGMERIGVHWYNAEKLLAASLTKKHLTVEGVFTHFANADEGDLSHTRLQLERFSEVLSFYDRHSLPTPVRHAANSGAILQFPESYLDMVRPGILFYGSSPSLSLPLSLPVKQALRWVTSVVFFKVVQPGFPVSYGSSWSSPDPTRIITLPVGYGDGYVRSMSGKAEVLLHGRRVKVVGRICMDQVMVDIGWTSAFNGDEVVLLGGPGVVSEPESPPHVPVAIRIEELAAWAGTIPHEVLTSINTRVPRVYVEGGSRAPTHTGVP